MGTYIYVCSHRDTDKKIKCFKGGEDRIGGLSQHEKREERQKYGEEN